MLILIKILFYLNKDIFEFDKFNQKIVITIITDNKVLL